MSTLWFELVGHTYLCKHLEAMQTRTKNVMYTVFAPGCLRKYELAARAFSSAGCPLRWNAIDALCLDVIKQPGLSKLILLNIVASIVQ